MRKLLAVELLRKIRRWIELRENVVDAVELIAAKVVVSPQRAPHFVEVPGDLLERALDAREKTCAFSRVCDEVLHAE